jgi:hypothetical protein
MQTLSLPPTWGIADAQVRAFCDAVRHAIEVRESGGDEGYVTKREFARLSADSVVSLLSGAASGGSVPASSTYQTAIDAVRAIVMADPIFDFLRSPLDASGESGVGGAAITEEFRAFVSKVDGSMNTTWSVKTNVNGRVTGIALMTSAGAGSTPGTSSSHFAIMADRLSLINPSNDAIDAVPFSVDSSGNAIFTGTIFAAAGVFNGELSVGSSPAISGTTMTGSGAHVYDDGRFVLGKAAQNVVYDGTDLYLNGFKADASGSLSVGSIYSGAAVSDYNTVTNTGIFSFTANTTKALLVGNFGIDLTLSPSNNTLRTFEVFASIELYDSTAGAFHSTLHTLQNSRWVDDSAIGGVSIANSFAAINTTDLVVGRSYLVRVNFTHMAARTQSSGAAAAIVTDITAFGACQVQQLKL